MKYAKIVLSILLAATAVTGDYVVFKSKYSESQLFRAIADSLVHGGIGFLSSALFFTHETNISNPAILYNVIFCTFTASFIDIDHVFVAKSFLLKDFINVKQRGIFHCTSFLLLVTLVLIFYSYVTNRLNVYILTWMLVLAYSSHHIRDGNRRGLWFYPFGHTSPINKYVYVILTATLPHVFALIYKYKPIMSKMTAVDYNMVV